MPYIIRELATERQIREMLREHRYYIKVVIDVKRSILAGGGEAHYDCEQALLEDGSQQHHLCGVNWSPDDGATEFESIINLPLRDGNGSMMIQSAELRATMTAVINRLLGDTP